MFKGSYLTLGQTHLSIGPFSKLGLPHGQWKQNPNSTKAGMGKIGLVLERWDTWTCVQDNAGGGPLKIQISMFSGARIQTWTEENEIKKHS